MKPQLTFESRGQPESQVHMALVITEGQQKCARPELSTCRDPGVDSEEAVGEESVLVHLTFYSQFCNVIHPSDNQ